MEKETHSEEYKKNWIAKFCEALSGKQKKQTCYKTNKPCNYNCSGLCKESV